MKRRVPIDALAAGDRRLDGAAAHYVSHVLRSRPGDTLVAFDPGTGHEADATIASLRGGRSSVVELQIGPLRRAVTEPRRPIVWVQGLPKGDKCDAIVRDATELGATRIIVATTSRSVVRLDEKRGASRAERWMRISREAARQCGRAEAPAIDAPCDWPSALARVDATHARFCLWERATEPLERPLSAALGRGIPLAFACGPEGGLDEEEVEIARRRRWAIASLGPRVLRTETVAAAVLGAVEIWSGAW